MWPCWTVLFSLLFMMVTLTSGVCIENFDIHKDKIIRTEDSRQLGAKYLDELELTSREQCLKVCCQTENCDVFVFEEKSPGSCYLFHCGGPEDFKCKFTKHRNYTSGILSAAQHLAELEAQIRLTKHEKELTRLRKPEASETGPSIEITEKPIINLPESSQLITQVQTAPTISPALGVSDSNSPSVLTANPALQPPPAAQPSSGSPNRECSHFQFECRETHECIGIYNACDGVEQCADGSDEAPELKCPQQQTAPSASIASKGKVGTSSVPTTGLNKLPSDTPIITAVLRNHQIHPEQRVSSSEANAPPGPSGPADPPAQAPAINAPAHVEVVQPVQTLQRIIPPPQPPPPPPPFNVNPLGLYTSDTQVISPEQIGRQQLDSPFETKSSVPFNNEGDIPGNLWPKSAIAPPFIASSIPSQSPPNALPQANSHIFTHKGNGLVAEKERYRENPNHHVDYNNMVDLGPEYPKYSLGLSSVNGVGEGGLPPFRPLNPAVYNPGGWPLPLPSQNIHGVRPGETEQDSVNPLRNRLVALEMSSGTKGHQQAPMPPDYVFEETQGKLHALEAAAAMAAAMNSGQPRVLSGTTSNQLGSIDSSLQGFGNVVHDMTALQEKLKQDFVRKLKVSETEQQQLKEDELATNENPNPTTISYVQNTELTTISHQTRQKSSEETAVANLEARFTEEELVSAREGSPSGAILSLALGLCLTGILAGLVGCRLRLVRRRLRRVGKSSYAHDADFLVNGMYL